MNSCGVEEGEVGMSTQKSFGYQLTNHNQKLYIFVPLKDPKLTL